MKVLVIGKFGCNKIVTTDFVPRVGDKIDMFYEPLPTVKSVIAWPSEARLATLDAGGFSEKIEAVLIVD